MKRQMSFVRVCCQKEMMEFHARRHPIVCAIQGRCLHALPVVIRLIVLHMGNDVIPC